MSSVPGSVTATWAGLVALLCAASAWLKWKENTDPDMGQYSIMFTLASGAAIGLLALGGLVALISRIV